MLLKMLPSLDQSVHYLRLTKENNNPHIHNLTEVRLLADAAKL